MVKTLETQQPSYAIIMVADVLVPYRCQGITIHHNDSKVTIMLHESYHAILIMLQPFNKLCRGDVSPDIIMQSYFLYWLSHETFHLSFLYVVSIQHSTDTVSI